MSDVRFECPVCETSYSAERCGVEIRPETYGTVTVKCLVCGVDYDTHIQPNLVTKTPGWWSRTVMRNKPVTIQDGHATISKLR